MKFDDAKACCESLRERLERHAEELSYVAEQDPHYGAEEGLVAADIRLLLAEMERLREALKVAREYVKATEGQLVTRPNIVTKDRELCDAALRPAAPECHCTGDGHRRDCAFWISLAPDPTPEQPDLPLGHPYVTSEFYAQRGCVSCDQPEPAHRRKP